jgi:PTEN phosphatase family protein
VNFLISASPQKNFIFAIREMLLFSKEVEEWMAKDPENIIVIHCKGGKGNNAFLFYFFLF